MANRELLEWLGLTLADLLVYLAIAAIVPMFFVHDRLLDGVLAVAGIACAAVACPLGMKPKPEFSPFTNAVKLASYPLCLGLAIAAVVVHYVRFNG